MGASAIDRVASWTPSDVGKWLEGVGLGHLNPDFLKKSVNGEDLLSLNDADLSGHFGLEPQQIRELRAEITKLTGAPTPVLDIKLESGYKSPSFPSPEEVKGAAPAYAAPLPKGSGVVAVLSADQELLFRRFRPFYCFQFPFLAAMAITDFAITTKNAADRHDGAPSTCTGFCGLGDAFDWLTIIAAPALLAVQLVKGRAHGLATTAAIIACAVFLFVMGLIAVSKATAVDSSYGLLNPHFNAESLLCVDYGWCVTALDRFHFVLEWMLVNTWLYTVGVVSFHHHSIKRLLRKAATPLGTPTV